MRTSGSSEIRPTTPSTSSRARKAKARKARRAKIRAVAAARPGIRDYADAVNHVKMLARHLGGLASLKALVDALAK